METSENKYKLFRNFMMNELEITRDDIRLWTKEVVEQTVNTYLKNHVNVERLIVREVIREINDKTHGSHYYQSDHLHEIKRTIANKLTERLRVVLDPKQ